MEKSIKVRLYFSKEKAVFEESPPSPENTVFLLTKYKAYPIYFILGFLMMGVCVAEWRTSKP